MQCEGETSSNSLPMDLAFSSRSCMERFDGWRTGLALSFYYQLLPVMHQPVDHGGC